MDFSMVDGVVWKTMEPVKATQDRISRTSSVSVEELKDLLVWTRGRKLAPWPKRSGRVRGCFYCW